MNVLYGKIPKTQKNYKFGISNKRKELIKSMSKNHLPNLGKRWNKKTSSLA
jgi:hypothetical protein